MNYLVQFDKSMMIGHLKASNSTDRDVLHSRNQKMIANMELIRKVLLLPMVVAGIQILLGIPGLLILIGIFLIIIGSVLMSICVWCRKRLATNISIARAAYEQYMATLPSAHVTLPVAEGVAG